MLNTRKEFSRDVDLVNGIECVPEMLAALCEITGMRFAVIARVTETSWTACAVADHMSLGFVAGQELDIGSTFCQEVRASRAAVFMDRASTDPRYRAHMTPKIYGFESYVSTPILLSNGECFGSLCALDSRPMQVSDVRIRFLFCCFARLIARQLEPIKPAGFAGTSRDRSDVRRQIRNLRSLVIAMLATPAADEAGDSAARSIAARLHDNISDSSPLIDEALGYAGESLCGGARIVRKMAGDLVPRLREVICNTMMAYPDRKIIWNVSFEKPVYCDAASIEKLASCLLENALKHGASGSAVSCTALVKSGMFELTVWNHGNALSSGELLDIFKPRWRDVADRSSVSMQLHLCAEIARAHRGTIHATSSETDGTHFVVRIPLIPGVL